MNIHLYYYRIRRDILLGTDDNKLCFVNKKTKKIELIISPYNLDRNFLIFLGELLFGVDDLEALFNEHEINPCIKNILVEKGLIVKKFKIHFDFTGWIIKLKINGYIRFLDCLYLPLFIIGHALLMRYTSDYYITMEPIPMVMGILLAAIIHELSHILTANESKKIKVCKLSCYLLPLSLCTSFTTISEDLDNYFDDYMEVTVAGFKSQLLYSGILNLITSLLFYFNNIILANTMLNISSVNLIIYISNIFIGFGSDGEGVINSLFDDVGKDKLKMTIIRINKLLIIIVLIIYFLYGLYEVIR